MVAVGRTPEQLVVDAPAAQAAYVLREAFDRAGDGEGFELFFGATSGDVFASGDAGATWSAAATRLPPVYSVSGTR